MNLRDPFGLCSKENDGGNLFGQWVLGVGEIIGSVVVVAGVTYSAYKAEQLAIATGGSLTVVVGEKMLLGWQIAGALCADGINQLSGAIRGSEKDSIFLPIAREIITNSYVGIGNELSKEKVAE